MFLFAAENTSQLWIVGPIFICSGVLVCIKAFTHIYNRLHPERLSGPMTRGSFVCLLHIAISIANILYFGKEKREGDTVTCQRKKFS
jgi:hypothetical protein